MLEKKGGRGKKNIDEQKEEKNTQKMWGKKKQ